MSKDQWFLLEIRYQKRLCSPLQFGEAVRQLVRPSQPRARPELQSINLNREENRRAGSRHGTATQLYSAILAAARIIALMPPAQEKRYCDCVHNHFIFIANVRAEERRQSPAPAPVPEFHSNKFQFPSWNLCPDIL